MTPNVTLNGIHHVTAIASHAQHNLDFYTGVLGLRLVKRTVNFDDPVNYHLYYGDRVGTPGSILTFFVWPGAERGRAGAGQAAAIALAIPRTALGYWASRLVEHGVSHDLPVARFGEQVLPLRDPDGLTIELVALPDAPTGDVWTDGPVPAEHAIRSIHGVTVWESEREGTAQMLTGVLGFTEIVEHESWTRYTTGANALGTLLDVRTVVGFWGGATAAGTIHHIAWRTPTNGTQQAWYDALADSGVSLTDIRDRQYFRSIYFNEPGGVLFEIATDQPGFTVDEPPETLGTQLMLPPWLEPQRPTIEQTLPPLHPPGTPLASFDTVPTTPPDLGLVHRFVPATTPDQPTLLLLHGTGGDETSLLDLGLTLMPGAALLSPRGSVDEDGANRFFRRLSEGVFDLADLEQRTHELADFVELASQTYGFDAERVVAMGYSNGANIAASTLLLRQKTLAGAMLFHPMVPLEPDEPPFLSNVPIFVTVGEHDTITPPEQAAQLVAILEAAGARVTVYRHAGGHTLTGDEVQAAQRWLQATALDETRDT